METNKLSAIVEAAVRAPSVQNTQPWRFRLRPGEGESGTIDVFADNSRRLEVSDPRGRELYISCGAAIEFAYVAARSMALECDVELLPSKTDPDHLARLSTSGHRRPSEHELSLARAIPLRYTERGRFEDRPVPNQLIDRLEQAVTGLDAWLRVLDPSSDQTTAAVLVAMADEIEASSKAYEDEMALWLRQDPESRDGIVAELERKKLAGRASTFKLRSFGDGANQAATADPDGGPPPAEHPLVALLGTPGDDLYYWLQAGRALGRLLLTGAAEGLEASPMTQVLEVESTRTLLAAELGLVGHPQILLRLGFAKGKPTTHRRPLEEVLLEGSALDRPGDEGEE